MLPTPAGGLPLTTTSSINPSQVPSIAPSASVAAAAASAAAAAAASSASAGAKRPAATDLQQGPGTPSKRQATAAHRASLSGFPISTSASPSSSTLTPAPGFPTSLGPGTGASFSSSSSAAARHRHARSHSHAAPAMSVSTTGVVPVISLPQPTSAPPTQPYPSSPHRPPLPPPHPSSTVQQPPQSFITEDQLSGRSPDQLVATILQIQSQHQQHVAHLSAQYDNIVQQLGELRASLLAFYGGQAASYQAAMAVCALSTGTIGHLPYIYIYIAFLNKKYHGAVLT